MERINLELARFDLYDFPFQISYGIQEVHNRKDFYENINLANQKMYDMKMTKSQMNNFL